MKTRALHIILPLSLAVGVLLAMLLPGGGTGQNDQWFILENGRWILEHGFPRTDPFHVWGGSIVIENWLWSVIMYLAWSATGGAVGPSIVVWSIVGLLAFLTWRVSKTVAKSELAAALSALAVVVMLERLSIVVLRPTIATVALTMLAVLMLLKRIETGEARWLATVPAIMLLSFNLHMALAWLVILVPGVLMLVDVVAKLVADGLETAVRRSAEYALTVAASIAVTFLNPYGVDGVTFLCKTMGVASYKGAIIELRPLSLQTAGQPEWYVDVAHASWAAISALAGLLAVSIAITASSRRRFDPVRLQQVMTRLSTAAILLVAAVAASTVVAIRMAVLLIYPTALLVPLAADLAVEWARNHALIPRLLCSCRNAVAAIVVVSAIAAPALLTPGTSSVLGWKSEVDSLRSTKAWLALEEAGAEPGDRVWSDGDYGSMLVWKGYEVSFDVRPELIESSVNGRPGHHYYDYVDGQLDGDEKAVDRIMEAAAEAGCGWWVVDAGSPVDRRLSAGDSRHPYRRVAVVGSGDHAVDVYKTIDEGDI